MNLDENTILLILAIILFLYIYQLTNITCQNQKTNTILDSTIKDKDVLPIVEGYMNGYF